MTNDFKNLLIQLKKDCSQMQHSIEQIGVDNDDLIEIDEGDLADDVDVLLEKVNDMWNKLNQIV